MFNLPPRESFLSYHSTTVCVFTTLRASLNARHQKTKKLSSTTKSFLITMENIYYPVGGPVRVVVEEHLQLVGAAGVV